MSHAVNSRDTPFVPHDHDYYVPGCFRCELSRDEAIMQLAEEYDSIEIEEVADDRDI